MTRPDNRARFPANSSRVQSELLSDSGRQTSTPQRLVMIRDALPEDYSTEPGLTSSQLLRTLGQAQNLIYKFFLEIVDTLPPEDVLLEFKRLFINHINVTSSEVQQALYDILFVNNEEEFRHTLKRCCYILVNNWEASRHHQSIQNLVNLFEDPAISQYSPSPTTKRLRMWLLNFINSSDFQEIKLFCSRIDTPEVEHWTERFTAYLLVPQYVNFKNPVEQREAARARSQQIKERFKFDLAMYTAHSQSKVINPVKTYKNPTSLGEEVLRLIKVILARRGPFNYLNLANIFLKQIESLNYKEFKDALIEYLAFSIEQKDFIETLRSHLSKKFVRLYESHDEDTVTKALILRTCNKIISYLTTENRKDPSPLFILLLSQGNPLPLVIILLKIILVSKPSRIFLEARVAELILYYQNYDETDCRWIIDFMEILNIAFAIYAENVQYNLIKMNGEGLEDKTLVDLDDYRVFSQMNQASTTEDIPEELEIDENP